MRELRGDFRDIFNGFSVALDLKKLFAGFIGLTFTFLIVGALPFFIGSHLTQGAVMGKLMNKNYVCIHEVYVQAWQAIFALPWWGWLGIMSGLYVMLMVVWAYFGGMISRIAAVNLTKDEGLEFSKALSFAGKKYLAYFSPWIICALGFLFFFLCNYVGGWVGRIPVVGELLIAIFLPFAILSGFIMVFIIIGFIFGASFFCSTISVEGSDSFDAISRSFSYLYSRPWHYIFYNLVACVYGAVTTVFVWIFGLLMIGVALWAGQLGMGTKFNEMIGVLHLDKVIFTHGVPPPPGQEVSGTVLVAGYIFGVWLVIVVGLLISYVVSYKISSQTIIYLLLRKKVDDIDVKEIYEETEDEEELPDVDSAETEKEKKEG